MSKRNKMQKVVLEVAAPAFEEGYVSDPGQ